MFISIGLGSHASQVLGTVTHFSSAREGTGALVVVGGRLENGDI